MEASGSSEAYPILAVKFSGDFCLAAVGSQLHVFELKCVRDFLSNTLKQLDSV